eukprot:15467432-Alexandrium_andersonii.AAC.1
MTESASCDRVRAAQSMPARSWRKGQARTGTRAQGPAAVRQGPQAKHRLAAGRPEQQAAAQAA